MIYFIMCCRARYAAVKDIQSEYGKLFYNKTSSERFQESRFIKCIVKEYNEKCKKKIAHHTSIKAQYSQILQQYENLKDKVNIMNNETKQLQNQIQKNSNKLKSYQSTLNILHEYKEEVYRTGIVTPNMGVKNIGELNNRIKDIESTIGEIENNIEKLYSDIILKEKDIVKIREADSADLKELIIVFKSDIEKIYLLIEYIESQYDRVVQYYWYILEKKLKITKQNNHIKSFVESCKLYGIPIVDKNDLFQEECKMINTKVKDLTHLDIIVDEKIHQKKGNKDGSSSKRNP